MASKSLETGETGCETGEANGFTTFQSHYQRDRTSGEGVKVKSGKKNYRVFPGPNRSGEGQEPTADVSTIHGYKPDRTSPDRRNMPKETRPAFSLHFARQDSPNEHHATKNTTEMSQTTNPSCYI